MIVKVLKAVPKSPLLQSVSFFEALYRSFKTQEFMSSGRWRTHVTCSQDTYIVNAALSFQRTGHNMSQYLHVSDVSRFPPHLQIIHVPIAIEYSPAKIGFLEEHVNDPNGADIYLGMIRKKDRKTMEKRSVLSLYQSIPHFPN